MTWWQADLASIIPDSLTHNPARRRAAEDIASPERWTLLARSGNMVWAEYPGTGSAPYRMAIDLDRGELAGASCSCPSRQDPCKHILALILLLQGGMVPEVTGRSPAGEWVPAVRPRGRRAAAGRDQGRGRAGAGRSSGAAGREERVGAGVDELERWLDDLVGSGLGALVTRGGGDDRSTAAAVPGEWERMARRLVDAQAPGLARRVRRAAALLPGAFRVPGALRVKDGLVGEGAVSWLVEELAMLHLAVEGYRGRHRLAPDELIDLEVFIGWPQRREAALATPPVRDEWQVLGRLEFVEENLWVRRTWLAGRVSGQLALLLDHQPGPFGSAPELCVGAVVTGDLHFYPGAVPLRAVFENPLPAAIEPDWPGEPDLLDRPDWPVGIEPGLAAAAGALAANPWLETWPLLLRGVAPVHHAGGWRLVDDAGRGVPLVAAAGDLTGWLLLALGGGRPLELFGEWEGAAFRVLSIWRKRGWPEGGWWALPALSSTSTSLEQAPALTACGSPQTGEWIDLVREFIRGAAGVAQALERDRLAYRPSPREDGGAPNQASRALSRGLRQRAAILTLTRRAGYLPVTVDPCGFTPVPEESAGAESGGSPERTAILARRLGEILDHRPRLAPEWLRRLAAAGGVLPVESLPRLLELAISDPLVAPLVRPVLGRRGEWLAGLNPAWQGLIAPRREGAEPPPVADSVAIPAGEWGEWWRSRVTYESRPLGRDTIEIRWPTAEEWPGPDRPWPAGGEAGSVMPDLPGLTDLPDLTDLAIHLDQPFAAALAGIDPRFWEESWGRTPVDIVRAAARSPWRETLLAALTIAAARGGAAAWYDPLIAERLQEPTEEGLEIFPLLPPARQEHWMLIALQQSRSLEVDQPAFWVLTRSNSVWGRSLADWLWPLMRRELQERGSSVSWDWELLLARAAERFDPGLAAAAVDFFADVPAEASALLWPALSGFLETLRFRAAMADELRPDPGKPGAESGSGRG